MFYKGRIRQYLVSFTGTSRRHGRSSVYPLTPVPLSLSHADGTMLKTKKSTLTSALEMKVITRPPDIVHETVIDASFSSIFAIQYAIDLWTSC